MKYFIAIALIAAVASASYIKPAPISAEAAEIQEIIAAIHSPSTDPSTAAALEELLLDVLGIHPTPVQVGPAIVEQSPVSVGPAIIDFPLPDGGAVAEDVVAPSPVVIAPTPDTDAAASAPLVQIILNINQAAESSPVAVSPVVVPEAIEVSPVQVVDNAPVAPVEVVDLAPVAPVAPVEVVDHAPAAPVAPVEVVDHAPAAPVAPVEVVDHAPATPVEVVETAPVAVEPVIIGTPVLPAPAIVLPEELN